MRRVRRVRRVRRCERCVRRCDVRRCDVRSIATYAFERIGARLVYDVIGEGATAIVVPGGPGFGSTYLRDSMVSLADARRLVFIDQRGSGRSSGHEQLHALTIRTFVDDLDVVRGELGDNAIDLIGHSFGGLQWLFYALSIRTRYVVLFLSNQIRQPRGSGAAIARYCPNEAMSNAIGSCDQSNRSLAGEPIQIPSRRTFARTCSRTSGVPSAPLDCTLVSVLILSRN